MIQKTTEAICDNCGTGIYHIPENLSYTEFAKILNAEFYLSSCKTNSPGLGDFLNNYFQNFIINKLFLKKNLLNRLDIYQY